LLRFNKDIVYFIEKTGQQAFQKNLASFRGASYAMSSARPFAMAVTLRANALPMQVSKRLRSARRREVIPVEAKRDVV
jgi:hypothetical protein